MREAIISLYSSLMDAKKGKIISLKVLVDKQQKRVVFAEADKDFVDILLSFLTFPMGTIVRLIQKQPHPSGIGCLNSLYAALEKLETQYLESEKHKSILLRPVNSSGHMCSKLKVNIDDTELATYQIHGDGIFQYHILNEGEVIDDLLGAVFVNGNSKFLISDDLKIMHISSSFSFELLNKFGAQNLNALEEKTLTFGETEILSLLKLSWLSKTPLTDLYLMKRPDQVIGSSLLFESACLENMVCNCRELSLKMFLRKSDGKLLYVEGKEDFLDHLLSILSIPLGAVVKLLDPFPVTCINNLYKSVKEFNIARDIKTESHRDKLISAKIAPQFGYRVPLLGQNLFFHPEVNCQTQIVGSKDDRTYTLLDLYANPVAENGFVKKPTTFIVMDDLSFTPLSPMANIFVLNKLNVRISDIEEQTMSFGGEEALRLLAASLTTTSALSYTFKLNEKKDRKVRGLCREDY